MLLRCTIKTLGCFKEERMTVLVVIVGVVFAAALAGVVCFRGEGYTPEPFETTTTLKER